MSVGRQIFYNTLAQSLGKVFAALVGLLTVRLLAEFLQESGFGQYSTVVAFLGMLIVFADLGLYLITVREISRQGSHPEKFLSNALGLRLCSGIAILLLGAFAALFLPYDPLVKKAMFVGVAAFLFVSLNQVLVGIFQKHLVQYLVVVSETVGRIINLALVYFFIKKGLPLPFFITALLVGNAATFLFTFHWARRFEKFGIAFDIKVWKKILSASWPLVFAVILNLVYFKTDTVILSLFHNEEVVGVYALPYKLLEGFIAFPAMFVGLVMPLLSGTAFVSWEKFRQILQHSFDALALMAVGVVIGIMSFSQEIINLLKGERLYADSPALLQILIIATAVIFFGTLFGYAVVAVNQQRAMVKGYLGGAILGLGLYFTLIPRFSYWGAAWGTVITEVVVASYAYLLVQRASRQRISLKIFLPLFPAALVTLAFFHFTALPWVLEIAIGGIIYAVALIVFKAIPIKFVKGLVFLQ